MSRSTSQALRTKTGTIDINFVNNANSNMIVKVQVHRKKSIELALKEYSKITGNNFHTFEFFYEGKQIHKETPTKLRMQENDVVYVKKTGIFLKFKRSEKFDNCQEVFLQLAPEQYLQVAVEKYAKMVGRHVDDLILMFNGERVFIFHTPEYLGMKDNDIIEVEQIEGFNIRFINLDDESKKLVLRFNIEVHAEEVMKKYADIIKKDMESLRFSLNGQTITKYTVLEKMKFKEKDIITVEEMERINLRFVGLDHSSKVVILHLRIHHELREVMKKYTRIMEKHIDDIRFMFNGTRLWKSETPEDLSLHDNDIINVLPEYENINVKVIAQDGFQLDYSLKFKEPLGEFKKQYQIMVGRNNQRFELDDIPLCDHDTPKGREMVENDIIRVVQEF